MISIPGLSKPATPSNLLDKLYRQQAEMAGLMKKVTKLQSEMDTTTQQLQEYGIQYHKVIQPSGQYNAPSPNIQTGTYPTQVVSPVHTRNTQPTTMAPNATVQPTNVTAGPERTNAPSAPHTRLRPSSQPPAPSSGNTVPGVIDILANRAPYHTAEVQISSINEYGQVLMHDHYLGGDGNTTGIPTPEGYDVRLVTSKAGKTYRLMSVPALKITCSLTKPLPEDLVSRKRMLREWLAANDYLQGTDTSKAQFYTEYDAWGEEYTPFASLDGKGTTLYIYIGCESLNSAKPCPTLIA